MGIELSKPALDVGIVTADTERMLAFYRDVLGFDPLEPVVFPGFGSIQRLAVGQSILRLFAPDKAPPPSGGANDSIYAATGIRYITLVMDNIDEVVDACREFGAKVPSPVREIRPGVRAATVQDPDGNWIEMQSSRGDAASGGSPR